MDLRSQSLLRRHLHIHFLNESILFLRALREANQFLLSLNLKYLLRHARQTLSSFDFVILETHQLLKNFHKVQLWANTIRELLIFLPTLLELLLCVRELHGMWQVIHDHVETRLFDHLRI